MHAAQTWDIPDSGPARHRKNDRHKKCCATAVIRQKEIEGSLHFARRTLKRGRRSTGVETDTGG